MLWFPTMDKTELTRLARVGLETEIARLSALLSELGPQSSANGDAAPTRRYRKRRRMSPEARAKMSKMMKARWAARRKAEK